MLKRSYLFLSLAGCYGLPTKKIITNSEENSARIESQPNVVTLVVIRPYNYYYFGHPVEVLVNGISQVKITNQSFSVLNASPGQIEIMGQSGLLGPPSQNIKIEGHAGQVIYLLWKTGDEPNYSSVVPIITLRWQQLPKEDAELYLKDVEFIKAKNAS